MKKSILICGGTGFLGYHLAKKLIKLNWKVFSISNNKPIKKRKIKNVKYFFCDVSKKKKLNLTLNKIKVDIVINFSGYVDHTNKKNSTLKIKECYQSFEIHLRLLRFNYFSVHLN